MRWPGKIPAGTVCDEPLMTIDMLPTLTQQIGVELPKRTIDGKDVWPLIADQPNATSPHQAYFFYYHEGNLEAMRSGPWKLHFPHGYRTLGTTPPGRDGEPAQYDQVRIGLELYHLVDDIGESRDVAAEHPDVVARLSALADAMRQRLGDRLTNIKGTEIRPAGEVEPSPPPPPG
jgi:arylsulfatase A